MRGKTIFYQFVVVQCLALHSSSLHIPQPSFSSPGLTRRHFFTVSNFKSTCRLAPIHLKFRAKSAAAAPTPHDDIYEEERGDYVETMKYDLIVTMSEVLSGYAMALDDDQDAITSFYLQCLDQELHTELGVETSGSVNIEHSELYSQTCFSGVGGTSWEDCSGTIKSVRDRTKTSVSQLIKIMLFSTIEPILLHPELSIAADSVAPMPTPAASVASEVVVAAMKATSITVVDTSNIFFNVYMTISSMLSGLMKSLASIPINPSTIAAAITISVMAFVYKKIERREWTSFEDVKDDFNMSVPSRMQSVASFNRPTFQLPAMQPYATYTPYLMQSSDRYYDRQPSRSFYQQNGGREYEFYDTPRQGRPTSAFPNGGRKFDQPTSRSVNPPSILQDLTSSLQPRSPSIDPFAFLQKPSQSPSSSPINIGTRSPVVSANIPTSMGRKSYLSDLMSQPRGPDGYRSNRRNDNGLKQLQEGFASINSQLFSGIPSIAAMPQPTTLPTSVMMSRRSGAPKPIVTTSARTSLSPERSLMSELITNPATANAMARKQSLYDGGYSDRASAQRENAFSSQRNRNGNFPARSGYSGSPSFKMANGQGSQFRPSAQQPGYRQGSMPSINPYNKHDQRVLNQRDDRGIRTVSNRRFSGPGSASFNDGPSRKGNQISGSYDRFGGDRMESYDLNEFGGRRTEDFGESMMPSRTDLDGASTYSNMGAALQSNAMERGFDASRMISNSGFKDATGFGREKSFYNEGISIRTNGNEDKVKEGIGKSIMNSLSNFAAGLGFGKNKEASMLDGVNSPFGQSSSMSVGSGFGGDGVSGGMGGMSKSSGPKISNGDVSGAVGTRGGLGGGMGSMMKSSALGMDSGGSLGGGAPSGKSTGSFDAPGGGMGGGTSKSGGLGSASGGGGGFGKSSRGKMGGGSSNSGLGGGDGMSGRAGVGAGMSKGGLGREAPGGFVTPRGGMGGGMSKSGGLGSTPGGGGGFGKSSGGMMGGGMSKGGIGGGGMVGGAGMRGAMSKGGLGGEGGMGFGGGGMMKSSKGANSAVPGGFGKASGLGGGAPGGFGAPGRGMGGGISDSGSLGSTSRDGGGFGKSSGVMMGGGTSKGGLDGSGGMGGGKGMSFGGDGMMKSSKGASSGVSGGFGKSSGLGSGAPGGGMAGGTSKSGGLGSASGGGGEFGKSSRGIMGGGSSKGGLGLGGMGGGVGVGAGMSKGGLGGGAPGGFVPPGGGMGGGMSKSGGLGSTLGGGGGFGKSSGGMMGGGMGKGGIGGGGMVGGAGMRGAMSKGGLGGEGGMGFGGGGMMKSSKGANSAVPGGFGKASGLGGGAPGGFGVPVGGMGGGMSKSGGLGSASGAGGGLGKSSGGMIGNGRFNGGSPGVGGMKSKSSVGIGAGFGKGGSW